MRFSKIFILFVVFCLSLSCSVKFGYFKDDKKKAQEGIEKFRQNFNAENFDELFRLTSPVAQKEKSKDAFFELMRELRRDYGKILRMEVVESFVAVRDTSSRTVKIACKTDFEKKQDVQLFTWIVSDKEDSGLYEYVLVGEEEMKRLENAR